jgi:hypothetical protein
MRASSAAPARRARIGVRAAWTSAASAAAYGASASTFSRSSTMIR